MAETEPQADIPTTSQNHPPAIWFFFWGELAERSSFYGMRAILFLYLTTALGFSDTQAAPIYAAFMMGCYLLPLLGALISQVGMPEIRERYIMAHLDAETLAKAKALIDEGKAEEVVQLASAEVVGRAYQIAFAFPTILMALSLGVFAAGKRTYADEW